MVRVIVICEGSTEQEFCSSVLAPHLFNLGIYLIPTLPRLSRGGDISWNRLRDDLHHHLTNDRKGFVTTLIDYYGRRAPQKWPNAHDAISMNDVYDRVEILQKGIASKFSVAQQRRLIPYIQLHEFEALLFSDPNVIATSLDGDTSSLQRQLEAIVSSCGSPELINDRRDTSPSWRLKRLSGGYEKGIYAAMIAEEIGLTQIRRKCPGFDAWVRRLEGLGS